MSTIYEDVAALTERVAALENDMEGVQTQLSAIGITTLAEDVDIHELVEGTY